MKALQQRIFFSNIHLSLLISLHHKGRVKREAQISKRIPSLNNVYLLKGKVMLFFSTKKLNATFLFCSIVICVHRENEMALSELSGLSPETGRMRYC